MSEGKISIQQLIQEAEGPEGEQAMDLRVEFKGYGKPDQLWKTVLTVKRHLEVAFGPTCTFMTMGNDELVDENPNGLGAS